RPAVGAAVEPAGAPQRERQATLAAPGEQPGEVGLQAEPPRLVDQLAGGEGEGVDRAPAVVGVREPRPDPQQGTGSGRLAGEERAEERTVVAQADEHLGLVAGPEVDGGGGEAGEDRAAGGGGVGGPGG